MNERPSKTASHSTGGTHTHSQLIGHWPFQAGDQRHTHTHTHSLDVVDGGGSPETAGLRFLPWGRPSARGLADSERATDSAVTSLPFASPPVVGAAPDQWEIAKILKKNNHHQTFLVSFLGKKTNETKKQNKRKTAAGSTTGGRFFFHFVLVKGKSEVEFRGSSPGYGPDH